MEEEQREAGQGRQGGKREATEMTAAAERESSRRRQIEDRPRGNQEDGVGGKYCMGGTDTEESTSNIAEWIR